MHNTIQYNQYNAYNTYQHLVVGWGLALRQSCFFHPSSSLVGVLLDRRQVQLAILREPSVCRASRRSWCCFPTSPSKRPTCSICLLLKHEPWTIHSIGDHVVVDVVRPPAHPNDQLLQLGRRSLAIHPNGDHFVVMISLVATLAYQSSSWCGWESFPRRWMCHSHKAHREQACRQRRPRDERMRCDRIVRELANEWLSVCALHCTACE